MTTSTLKDELDRFCHEALDCYHHFRQSRVIFDQEQAKLDVLNDTAQHFFSLLNNMFLDGIVLNMARLTDPEFMRGRKNLTIQTIINAVMKDPKAPAGLNPLAKELHDIAAESDVWRNKRVAHIDYGAALGTLPIPPLFLNRVQRFYDALQEFINLIYRALYQTVYPIDAVDTKGADELLRAMDYSHALRQYQRSHVQLFDQIVHRGIPPFRGAAELMPFCPGCVPDVKGMEKYTDVFDNVSEYLKCEECRRLHCQNGACKKPLDQGSGVAVPMLAYRMSRPIHCSECAAR